MKTVVLVVVLAAAACSKKPPDCNAEIAKGIERYAEAEKSHSSDAQKSGSPRPGSQRIEAMAAGFKEALTERCKADKWSPEVLSCFGNVTNISDIRACAGKLSSEQQTRLTTEIQEAMMSRMGAMGGQRMPPGMPGHPPLLNGNRGGSGASPGGSAAGSASAPAPGGSTTAAPEGSATPPPSGASTPPAGTPAAGSSGSSAGVGSGAGGK
jgi:hypothetical protein